MDINIAVIVGAIASPASVRSLPDVPMKSSKLSQSIIILQTRKTTKAEGDYRQYVFVLLIKSFVWIFLPGMP